MKKSVIVFLHIGFWFCYFSLVIVMLAIFGRTETEESRLEFFFEVVLFFALVPSAITFYAFYSIIFPRFLQKGKILKSIIYGILIAVLAADFGYFCLYSMVGGEECTSEDDSWATFFGITFFMAFISMAAGVVGIVIKGFITWFDEVKLKEELARKNHKMELALVKSQLDPHFLFNTINNIDVLILKSAEEASEYLNKLSDIMRFMLFETKTEKILLSKEMEYIDKYIELQKIRTANLNYVNYTVIGSPKKRKVAPMIFIPFIENAFKHTTNKKLENAIVINILIEEGYIKMECINKLDPSRKLEQESNGLGNELIKKRLQLIYPEKHQLKVTNIDNVYSVNLTIDNE